MFNAFCDKFSQQTLISKYRMKPTPIWNNILQTEDVSYIKKTKRNDSIGGISTLYQNHCQISPMIFLVHFIPLVSKTSLFIGVCFILYFTFTVKAKKAKS